LSIKAKDAADESGAMSKLQADANASTGSTNLGALLKAKLSGSNE
jgi:small subunit ribosomal protein S1